MSNFYNITYCFACNHHIYLSIYMSIYMSTLLLITSTTTVHTLPLYCMSFFSPTISPLLMMLYALYYYFLYLHWYIMMLYALYNLLLIN
jgi:hypothetical protein